MNSSAPRLEERLDSSNPEQLSTRRFPREGVWWLVIVAGLLAYFLVMRTASPIGDEKEHVPQISRFLNWRFTARPGLGMLPVYHFLVFLGVTAMDGRYLHDVRLVSFLGAVLCVPAFYVLARKLYERPVATLRTVQFTFLPIVFYLFPLVYTDLWALLPVLLTVKAALDDRPNLSCVLGITATIVRQTNIVWAGFAWLLFLFASGEPISKQLVKSWLRRTKWFVVFFDAFLAFLLANGGVAIGLGARQSLTVGFSTANIWFFFLLCSGFLLPLWYIWSRDAVGAIRRRPQVALSCLVVLLPIIYFTYQATHIFNSALYSFHLRNRLLAISTHGGPRIIATGFIAWGVCGVLLTKFSEKRFALILPIGLAAIYLMPFIEQRYYIELLVLYIALRKPVSLSSETMLAVLFIVITAALTSGMVNGMFLL